MSALKDVVIRVGADTKAFVKGMQKIKLSMKNMRSHAAFATKALAVGMAAVGVPMILAVREAQKFELGMASVQKVADLSKEGLKSYENQIRELSKTIPATTAELHETAAAAAVLGVRGADNLTKFAETMAKLAVTTDVSGGDAAKAISRIISLSGEADSSIDQFGSALVELGNNFKASESEILSNAIRIRQSTANYNLASHEILAMAAASREAGIRAELVGTAMGRVFIAMDTAMSKGGESLQAILNITGMARDEFEKTFRESPAKVFRAFINGLSTTNRESSKSITLLGKMGLQGQRLLAVLPSLAKLKHRVTGAFEMSNEAYKENNALNKEANVFFATSAQKQKVFNNSLKDLALTLGKELTPLWDDFLESMTDLTTELNDPKAVEGMKSLADGLLTIAEAAAKATVWLIKMPGAIGTMKQMQKDADAQLRMLENKGQPLKPGEGVRTAEGPGLDLLNDPFGLGTGDKTGGVGGDQTNIDEEIEKQRERAALLGEAKAIDDAIKREEEIVAKREFDAMLLQVDEEKHGKELELLRKHFLSKNLLEKQNAVKRVKQLKNESVKELELEKAKHDAAKGLASASAEFMTTLLGKSNIVSLALTKAMAISDVIIKAKMATMSAIALSPKTVGEPMVSMIRMQKYISLATIAAQTLVQPKAAAAGAMVGRAAGTPATGDHQLYNLSPGELVSPRDTAQGVIEREAAQHASKYNDTEDMDDTEDMEGRQEVVIELSDDASDFIFAQQRRNEALAAGVY